MKKECGVTIGEVVIEQTDSVLVNNSTAGSNLAGEDMWARGFRAKVTVPIRCLNCPLVDEIVVARTGMAPLADVLREAQEQAEDRARDARIDCRENLHNP